MAANRAIVRYQFAYPPDLIRPNIQRGTVEYEGGLMTSCLIHSFDAADDHGVSSALEWARRSLQTYASPSLLKVLGVDDNLKDKENPRLVVLSEDVVSTFQRWASTVQLVRFSHWDVHVSIPLADKLRLLFQCVAELDVVHGAINSDNIFLNAEGKLKLGMVSFHPDIPPATDVAQLNAVIRDLRLSPFPCHLDQLLRSITRGHCWTHKVSDLLWRRNNLRFAVLSPTFMSATAQLQRRESTWYKLELLRVEKPKLYLMVEEELRVRLIGIYPEQLGTPVIKNWVAIIRSLPAGHWLHPLIDAVDRLPYNAQETFSFCKFGRHLKVHKPRRWTDEVAEAALNFVMYGFLGILHEVLSGFGIRVDY